VLARFRRVALAVTPAVLVVGALGVVAGTADARTASPAASHAPADVSGHAEARDQDSQQCQSSSSPATCSFATGFQLPYAVSITAQTSPETGQNATINWTLSCSVNGGATATSSSIDTGKTPFKDQLKLPKSESGDCTVNASTTVAGGGSLTAVLAYTFGVQVTISVPTGDTKAGAPLAFFMCMRDAKESHATGAGAVLGTCAYQYVSAWTYNGKTLVHGGLCLTDPHGGWVRTKLLLEKCTGASDQTWALKAGPQTTGSFVLKSPHLCLDDPKYTKVINTPLTVYSCNGGPDEQWALSA
jgi:hypothetical protein